MNFHETHYITQFHNLLKVFQVLCSIFTRKVVGKEVHTVLHNFCGEEDCTQIVRFHEYFATLGRYYNNYKCISNRNCHGGI